jgi:hypothetical protein
LSLLPKTSVPTLDIIVPSTKEKFSFSRFKVSDEKILLIAKESGEYSDLLKAVKQIINNCAQDAVFDINKLAIFDIEYIYMKLHAASVSNMIEFTINDPDDNKNYDFKINLDEVEIKDEERESPDIKLPDGKTSIHLIYPPATLYGDKEIIESKNVTLDITLNCIDKIFVDDSVIDTKTVKKEELEKWVLNLDIKTYNKIKSFFDHMPSIEHIISYTNSLGVERKYILRTLSDFFLL